MAAVNPVVEIAFASNPRDVSQTWTNVTPWLQTFSTRRGRTFELDQFEAGTCSVMLNNQDRRFDPTYAAGPYYPNIVPGKRVRITAGRNIIARGSFETGLPGFTGPASATIAQNLTTAHDGVASAVVTTANFASSGIALDGSTESLNPVRINANTQYTFSLWARRQSAGSTTMTMGLSWLNSSDFFISSSTQNITLNSTAWQRFTFTATSPNLTASVSPWFGTLGASGVFTFYTDSWQFEPGAVATTFTDGVFYVFHGFIDAWPQTWQAKAAAHVQLTATDATKLLNLFPLNGDYIGSVIADGPWGYWKFDASNSTTPDLTDASGHGNDGTWAGSLPTSTGGAPMPATSYSKYFGTDDYMTHGTTGWTSGGFTLECWVYPNGWDGNDSVAHGVWQSIAPTWSNPANGIVIMKWSDNNLYFRIVSPGAAMQDLLLSVNASNLPSAIWHHWAFTASSADGLNIYRDGVLVAGPTWVGTLVMPAIAPSAPRWGQGHDAYAAAYLAHAAIHGACLRADQVADRYKAYRCYFPAQTAPQRIDSVLDVVDWPAGDRSYSGGISNLSADSPVQGTATYLQTVGQTEAGRLFIDGQGRVRLIGRDATLTPPFTTSQASFGDGGPVSAELPYTDITFTYDDTRLWNEVRLQRKNASHTIVERDATIQAGDIVRRLERTGLLHSTDAETRAAAQWLLLQYRNPVLRVDTLTVAPERDPTRMYPQVLGREIGDRVTVVRRPQRVGSPMSQECYIEGIAHDWSITDTWRTTYRLSLADSINYWVLGGVVSGLTLNGGIDNVQTTITVGGTQTNLPLMPFYLRIDTETMQCTAGAGTATWTVDRHVFGSAASHSNAAAIVITGLLGSTTTLGF